MSDPEPIDGVRRIVVGGGMDPTDPDPRHPGFGDSVRLVVDHRGGPRRAGAGPTTISKEGLEELVRQFTQFVGARIASRFDQGKSSERIEVLIDLKLEE